MGVPVKEGFRSEVHNYKKIREKDLVTYRQGERSAATTHAGEYKQGDSAGIIY